MKILATIASLLQDRRYYGGLAVSFRFVFKILDQL